MKSLRGIAVAALFAIGASAPTLAHAQQKFPVKPVRLVVAFTPGGTTDILVRMVAPGMSETFGQPIVIENRPGAGGVLAAMEHRYQRSQIQAAAHRYEQQINEGVRPMIGLNRYAGAGNKPSEVKLMRTPRQRKQLQVRRLQKFKRRHRREAVRALDALARVVENRSVRPGASMYLVTDRAGNKIAGNVEAVPSDIIERPVVVVPPPPEPPPAVPPPPEPLAVTGLDVTVGMGLGVLALVAGTGLVLLARRRRGRLAQQA